MIFEYIFVVKLFRDTNVANFFLSLTSTNTMATNIFGRIEYGLITKLIIQTRTKQEFIKSN
jgi:hypothetical protein